MAFTGEYTVEHDNKIDPLEMFNIARVLLNKSRGSIQLQHKGVYKVRVNTFAQGKQIQEELQDLLRPREYIQYEGEYERIYLRLAPQKGKSKG